jgi:MFS family permease
MSEPLRLGRLWALMLTVFVDMLGFLMVVPLLPFYATRLGATAFDVGLMVSVYAVAQLATSPFWGKLSDRRGRRPMLLVGISISALAHLLFALACSNWALGRFDASHLIGILYLSRFVMGAGGATTGVVQAYVGDAVVPEERAKALGWISAATSAGVMIGPAIGSLASTIAPSAPGLLAAALCVVNFVSAKRFLPESSSHEARADAKKIRPGSVRRRLAEILAHPTEPVARLVWIYGVGMMAFMAMNAILALFLQARFGFTEKTIGYVYTGVGSISLVMRSIVLGPAVRRLGERGVMRAGLACLTLSFALQPLAPSLPLYALALVLVPVGTALLFPATSSLVSRFSARHEFGTVMGVQQAYGGIARLVGPVWAGAAFETLGVGSPFWISSLLAASTLVFAWGLKPPPHAQRGGIAAT